MISSTSYDTCIVGGGLAGLSLSIQLARQGYTVALFEKESYPFHKVCGEYISLESWDFIESLGVPLSQMKLPLINKLEVSAPNGNLLQTQLPLGGFGISRYLLDNQLANIARQSGVTIHDNCKVENVQFNNGIFEITTAAGSYTSHLCCGSFGKRSNLDVKWKRPFALAKPGKLNNYIGIKYHITYNQPADTIALHNFKDGYCGISQIEDNQYCLCYLTNAAALKAHGSIAALEKNVLSENPHLQQIFNNSQKLYETPLTISQVSFAKKQQVENHVLMLGDAAGMITPLCGNGMSMALHSSQIAAGIIHPFLQGRISRKEMEDQYTTAWQHQFGKRLQAGRLIQQGFGKKWTTNLFIATMKKMPWLTRKLIQRTHGNLIPTPSP